ncbi:hypothetical protein PYCC9005_004816 [Savitreella phatthalungensis]
MDLHTGTVLDTFQRYVRPVKNPLLSSFCTSLTGISQAQVDGAEDFDAVLCQAVEWLAAKTAEYSMQPLVENDSPGTIDGLTGQLCGLNVGERDETILVNDSQRNWAIATDTRRDLSYFFTHQLRALGYTRCPRVFTGAYVDTRSSFARFTEAGRLTLPEQLRVVRLTFQGAEHSGLDDATNVARLAAELHRRGARLRTNAYYLYEPRAER